MPLVILLDILCHTSPYHSNTLVVFTRYTAFATITVQEQANVRHYCGQP